jgi:uncharacterized protein with HEPN domain
MPRDEACLLDMLLWAQRARSFNDGLDWHLFDADIKAQAATLHALQVIGEAAGKVSAAYQVANPEIPWRKITGLRHRLVHDYGRVDMSIIWDIVTTDVDPLIAALVALVPPETP